MGIEEIGHFLKVISQKDFTILILLLPSAVPKYNLTSHHIPNHHYNNNVYSNI